MAQTLIPQILPFDIIGSAKDEEIFNWGPQVIYFSRGRTALLYGVKMLASVKPGKYRLLVPAFLCEEALWPLREAGFKIDYYTIDDKWASDLQEISRKTSDDLLAILAVHYFGIPQKFPPLKSLCENRGIYLIEDCAHAFFGQSEDRPLGLLGDISIFSLRKFLPLPDGGALMVNNPDLITASRKEGIVPNRRKALWLKILLRSIMNGLRAGKPTTVGAVEELCPRADLKRERADFIENEGMSDISRRLLYGFDLKKIASLRRQNFNRLAHGVADLKEIELAYSAAEEGWNPYVLPIYVDENRQFGVLKSLIRRGIMATDWPTLPPDLEGTNKIEALHMQKRIILLPLHQNIGERGIKMTVETLKDQFK